MFTGKLAKNFPQSEKVLDEAFNSIVVIMRSDTSRTWTSTELFDEYSKVGGHLLSRKKLVENIKKELANEIVVLWSNGFTSLVVFKCHANIALRIKELPDEEEEENNEEESLKQIAKLIKNEVKEIPRERSTYKRRINVKAAKSEVSPTLSKLLSMLNS